MSAVTDPDAACVAMAAHPDSKFISGGTNLIDLMRLEIERPPHLIDGQSTAAHRDRGEFPDGHLRIGASARKRRRRRPSGRVRSRYPVLAEALLAGAVRARYGTKRPWAAICCSEHDCHYFLRHPPRNCKQASAGRRLRRSTRRLTATMPFWVQARHALPPILPIWPWR